MKEFLLTATYLVGAGELLLAAFFWKTNSGNEIRRVMVVLSSAVAIWTVSNSIVRIFGGLDFLSWLSGVVVVTAIVHLSLVFPFRVYPIDRWHVLGLYFPAVFFAYLLIFTHTVVGDVYYIGDAAMSYKGPLFPAINIFLGGMFFWGLATMLYRIKSLDGFFRKNMKLVAWSLLLGGLPGVLLAVLHLFPKLPYNDLYGPLSTSIWLVITSYIILKK